MDTGGRGRGEGEVYGESNMETYITICKIDSQREFVSCLRKLKQGLCTNLEGWDGAPFPASPSLSLCSSDPSDLRDDIFQQPPIALRIKVTFLNVVCDAPAHPSWLSSPLCCTPAPHGPLHSSPPTLVPLSLLFLWQEVSFTSTLLPPFLPFS